MAEERSIEITRAISRFESAWARGKPPQLDSFIPQDEADNFELIAELIAVDLERRLKLGEPIRVEKYLERFPGLSASADNVVNLVVAEYQMRCRQIPGLSADEYLQRFPQYRNSIVARLPETINVFPVDGRTLSPPNPTDSESTALYGNNSADSIPVAIKFGDYELLEEIARGGMGVVYKANQISLKRTVALKMILTGQLASTEEIQRFYVEAEAAAKLNHPGIVPVYEVGQWSGRHFFSMGFVEGQSLADRVKHEDLIPQREAADLMRQVAEAVEYAHQRGVIHRDLKPANVLLDEQQRPKVTDFGLAKQSEGGSDLTGTGQILGTPSYMPPEQAEGKTDDIGPQADIYSLGAILYRLLTGRPPFQADNVVETLKLVQETEPVSLRQLNPVVSRDLETICLKCLNKSPVRRYQTAGELAADLRRWLAREPIVARPVGRLERLFRWSQRRPAIAGLICAVVLITIIGFAGVSWQWQKANRSRNLEVASRQMAQNSLVKEQEARREAEQARKQAEGALKREQAARVETDQQRLFARQHAYVANMSLAYRAWEREDRELAWRTLLAQRPSSEEEDLRGFEWYCLWNMFPQPRVTLSGHADTTNSVAFSPDGKILASGAADNTIRLWDVETGKVIRILDGHRLPYIQCVAFSPDGKRLASVSARRNVAIREVKVWDAETGQEQIDKGVEFSREDGSCLSLTFSQDSKYLIAALAFRGVSVWELSTREAKHRRLGRWMEQVAISMDGKTLAGAGHFDGNIWLWDFPSGEKSGVIAAHDHLISTIALSPDGQLVASASPVNRNAILWDVRSLQRIATLVDSDVVTDLKFSPDGRLLAIAMGNDVQFWGVAERERRSTLHGHGGKVHSVAFSPDGKFLATGTKDGTVRIWDVPQIPSAVEGHTASVNCVAWSPDGTSLMTGGDDRKVLIWDAESRQLLASLDGHAAPVQTAAWASDGTTLVTGGEDNVIRVWDVESRKQISVIRAHTASVKALVFVGRGNNQFYSASEDGLVKLWELGQHEVVQEYEGVKEISSLAISPDARTIALGDERGGIKLINSETGLLHREFLAHSRPVKSIDFSHDGTQFVSAGADRSIKFWKTETAEETGMPIVDDDADSGKPYVHVEFMKDEKHLISINADGSVEYWSLESRKKYDGQSYKRQVGRAVASSVASLSSDGKQIAVGCGEHSVKIFDVSNGAEYFIGGRSDNWSVAFSPDGGSLAVGSYRAIRKIDVDTGQETVLADELPDHVVDLDYSRDGILAAVYGSGHDQIEVWNPKSPETRKTLPTPVLDNPRWKRDPTWGVYSIRFSPNGHDLFAGCGVSDGTPSCVTVWDPSNRRLRREIPTIDDYFRTPACSSSGRFLAAEMIQHSANHIRCVRVWDSDSQKEIMTTPWIDGRIHALVFSPDEQLVATARDDGNVRLWDVNSASLTALLSVDSRNVGCVVFSPDGRLLATGGSDKVVKLWNLQTLKQIAIFSNFTAPVKDLAFSPDGKTLAAVSGDYSGRGEVRIWRATSEQDAKDEP